MCQLRGIKAVFQSAAKDKGADMLSDEECIAVLRKLAKQVTQPAYSVYLLYWYVLYWYKSRVHSRPPQAGERDSSLYLLCWDKRRVHTCHAQAGDTGTQPAYSVYFCFTGTKEERIDAAQAGETGTQFTCFTGTRVQILTPTELQRLESIEAYQKADVC
jgi:hypothetical protein